MASTIYGKGSIQWLDVPKGTLAFMNSFSDGLVPCRIDHVRKVTYQDGRVEFWFDCLFTATRGPWKRGDREARDMSAFIPRHAVMKSRQRPGHMTILAYNWADKIPSIAKES